MTVRTQDYAHLADHAYDRDGRLAAMVNQEASIGGVRYRIVALSDRPSGYQGAIYQHLETGEFVVAHRGTEFDREKAEDLFKTDGGMVATRSNRQADDAIELTRQALALADEQARQQRRAPHPVTTTGHSLGGTLAQITAHHFDLRGETFNAYGAVSLDRRIGKGGHDVVNHVMAADLVSAASEHYGQVRVYAGARGLATLHAFGYDNTRSPLDVRAPVPAAVKAMLDGEHDMHNFLPFDGQRRADVSILDQPGARALAERFDPMIDKFRQDIETVRVAATMGLRSPRGLVEDAVDWMKGPLPPGLPAHLPAQAHVAPAHAVPADPTQPEHPLHARFAKAYDGVCAIDRAHGREPCDGSRRIAAALAVESTPLRDIAAVVISDDRKRMFAVDTVDPLAPVRNRVQVDIATAFTQPLEASHERWQALTHAAAQQQDLAAAQTQDPAPRLSRTV